MINNGILNSTDSKNTKDSTDSKNTKDSTDSKNTKDSKNLEVIKSNFNSNTVFGVIGVCGITGNLVARILMDNGFSVIGSDMVSKEDCKYKSSFKDYNIKIFYNGNNEEFFDLSDYIILPPSIPKNSKVYEIIEKKQIPIIDFKDIFKLFLPKKPVLSITGTNGKTTTTNLIKHISYLGGIKPSEHNLRDMQGNTEYIPSLQARLNGDVAILETGTFGDVGSIKLTAKLSNVSSGLLTNITPDHLDKGKSFLDYAKVKGELINELKGKQLIVNSDDPTIMGLIRDLNYKGDLITFGVNIKPFKIANKTCVCGRELEIKETISGSGYFKCGCGLKYKKPDYIAKNINLSEKSYILEGPEGEYKINLLIEGLHNVYNSLGAIVVGREFLKIHYKDIQKSLSTFTGVPGRMETVAIINNKKVIVDYAHNPGGVETVLREFKNIYGDITVVITISSESGIKGDLEILKKALPFSKYIIPASYSAQKVAQDFINNNSNNKKINNKIILDHIDDKFLKEGTLGATEEEVKKGIIKGLESDSNVVIAIGEAATKFKTCINDLLV